MFLFLKSLYMEKFPYFYFLLPRLTLLYKTLRILNAVSQVLKVIIEFLSLII